MLNFVVMISFLGYRSFRTDNLLPWSFVRRRWQRRRRRCVLAAGSRNPRDNFFFIWQERYMGQYELTRQISN